MNKQIILTAILAVTSLISFAQGQIDSVNYAISLMNGQQGKIDYNTGLSILHHFAAQGDENALNALGITYKLGLGVEKNEDKAFDYWTQSAQGGYGKAWVNLGYLFNDKNAKHYNPVKSNECFHRAIACDYSFAYYPAGCCAYDGIGTTVNYQLAFQLFQESAMSHCPEAMYMLGICYMNGQGTARDLISAQEWLENARLYGIREARLKLEELDSLKMQADLPNLNIRIVDCFQNGKVTFEFTLPQDAQCQVSIASSLDGGILATQNLGFLPNGEHQTTITASLRSGIYVLSLSANNIPSSITFYKP